MDDRQEKGHAMSRDELPKAEDCNCLAFRQAARHVSQFYDLFLAPTGLRTTQFSILAKLRRRGPLTINALAEELVMDRTTLGRNILPLEREGLVAVVRSSADRRSKELHLTEAGLARLRLAVKEWARAQARFESVFGGKGAAGLRTGLRGVAGRAAGRIPAVAVTDNQAVRAGDVLVRIDDRDYRAAPAKAEGAVAAARATLANVAANRRLQDAVIGQARAEVDAMAAEVSRA